MWQNRLCPCAVLTKASAEFTPHYLAEIRHDMRQTTARRLFWAEKSTRKLIAKINIRLLVHEIMTGCPTACGGEEWHPC
jgi:hypothetical protein